MAEILKKGKKSKEIIYGPHDFNGFGFDFWLKQKHVCRVDHLLISVFSGYNLGPFVVHYNAKVKFRYKQKKGRNSQV